MNKLKKLLSGALVLGMVLALAPVGSVRAESAKSARRTATAPVCCRTWSSTA
jgi:hypothetical protein